MGRREGDAVTPDEDDAEPFDCPACADSGACEACEGTGRLSEEGIPWEEQDECDVCDGTGECPDC